MRNDMIQARKKSFAAAILIVLCLFSLRVLKLDVDLPGYGVGAYNPSDEGIYAFMALDQYNNGAIGSSIEINEDLTVENYTAYHCRNNVLQNLLVYGGLELLGDNYYGFRAPIVLIALLNLGLIMYAAMLLVKQYGTDYQRQRWLVVAVGLFYTISFPYLISSRVVEPTILRFTFGLLTFCALLQIKRIPARFFLMGFIATLGVELVYITNVFFYIPIFITGCIVGWKEGKKAFGKCAGFCVLGVLTAMAIGGAYYYFVWGSGFLSNAWNTFMDFTNVSGYTTLASANSAGMLHALLNAILKFFSSNTFLYHMPLLTAFLLYLPIAIYLIFKEKDEVLAFCLTAVFGLLLQTWFTEDYIFRKAFLIQPFVIFALMIVGLKGYQKVEKSQHNKIWYGIYTLLVVCFTLICLYNRLYAFDSANVHDFTGLLKTILFLTQACGILMVIIICAQKFNYHIPKCIQVQKKISSVIPASLQNVHWNAEKAEKMCLFILIACSGFASIICGMRYVWLNQYTMEKDVMVDLQKLEERPIMGSYAYGFTLYNDFHPVLMRKEDMWEVMEDAPEDFLYIDVSTSAGQYVRDYLDLDVFSEISETVYQTELLERRFSLNGNTIHFGLYEPVNKNCRALQEQVQALKNNPTLVRRTKWRKKAFAAAAEELYAINCKYEKLLIDQDILTYAKLQMDKALEVEGVMEKYEIRDDERGIFTTYPPQTGTINEPIFGSIMGDIRGDINAPVYGDIYGNVYGVINAPVLGKIYGVVMAPVSPTENLQM